MPKGFFRSSEVLSSRESPTTIPRCGTCALCNDCKSPKMPVTGEGRLKTLVVAEAPGCISEDTLIDTAFRNKSKYPYGISIKELANKNDQYVYSFDIQKQDIVIGKVLQVWCTGRKPIYRVHYEWKFPRKHRVVVKKSFIDVTSNHKFLLKRPIKHDPFKGLDRSMDYLSIDNGLLVGDSLQPFYRNSNRFSDNRHHIGSSWRNMRKESRFLVSYKHKTDLGRLQCHHIDKDPQNDEWDNLQILSISDHAKLHFAEGNCMNGPEVRKKRAEIMKSERYRKNHSKIMKKALSKPGEKLRKSLQTKKLWQNEKYRKVQRVHLLKRWNDPEFKKRVKDRYDQPEFYFRFLLGRQKIFKWTDEELQERFLKKFSFEQFPVNNHKVIKIEYLGEMDVYDMEVEDYHNFATNGIFVHNSQEDIHGTQLIGPAGQKLREHLDKIGIDLDRDCWKTNSLCCRPEKNKSPTSDQIEACRPNLLKAIKELQPERIILLGGSAVNSLIGSVWKKDVGAVKRWVGWKIPDQTYNAWICPTYHSSYIRREKNEILDLWFSRHLEEAFKTDGRPWNEVPNYEKKVIITMGEIAAKIIQDMEDYPGIAAFDYETTMLKPDSEDSQIVCCSIAWGTTDVSQRNDVERCIAFPLEEPAKTALGKFLRSPIPKVAANMKFEDRWTRRIFGHRVRNWKWDTMQAAHVLDNRPGITSLKFQAYVQLGFPTYDDHIAPFLQGGSTTVNRILSEVSIHQLLMYNGLDSILELELAFRQMDLIGVRPC